VSLLYAPVGGTAGDRVLYCEESPAVVKVGALGSRLSALGFGLSALGLSITTDAMAEQRLAVRRYCRPPGASGRRDAPSSRLRSCGENALRYCSELMSRSRCDGLRPRMLRMAPLRAWRRGGGNWRNS